VTRQKPVIFISCGQSTGSERALGQRIREMVDASQVFTGYFAENQSSFQGVTRNIFVQLYKCFGLICVMHDRGSVSSLHGEPTIRASVWIEQEIAIAAFLAEVLDRDVKTRVYIQNGIHREGVRDKVIINPKEFDAEDEILVDLPIILREWAELFAQETENLNAQLEVVLQELLYNKEMLALDLSNFQPVFYDKLMEMKRNGAINDLEQEVKNALNKVYLDTTNYSSHLHRIVNTENYSSRANEIGMYLGPAKATARESVSQAIQLVEQAISNSRRSDRHEG
jgi:hypothetical protein